jgi:ABC-type branched-subunit amino acid transport system substrate-binding protein
MKNKYCYIVLLLVLLSACKTRQQPSVPEKKEDKSNTTKPKAKEEIPSPVKTEKKDEKKETYVISFMLPFQSDKVDLYSTEEKKLEIADVALDYYNGAKLAIDSLKKNGYSFTVNVIDSQNDSASVVRATAQPSLKNSNLIIGPVYPAELAGIAKFSSVNKIWTVSPLSPSPLSLYGNPYFIMANNSLEQHAQRLAEFTRKDLKAKKVIIVWNNQKQEGRYGNEYKNVLDSLDKSIVMVDIKSVNSILQELSKTSDNIIFIPSSDQAFVITAVKYLNTLDPIYTVTVLGHPRWFDFPNLDMGVLQKLNVHLTTSFYPDYADPSTIDFVRKYRNVYNTEPSEYAFKGFDHTFYFGGSLAKEGKNFYKKLDKQKLNSTTFDFKQTDYGFQNQYLNVVKFEDDQLREKK